MKTLGLIGGTSWHSTIEYYRLINSLVSEKIGSKYNPPLLMYSLNVALMREGDTEKIKQAYLDISKNLSKAGAEAILICANTPHLVYDFVQPQLDIPILHIADAIAKDANAKGLKNLGLLGTMPTMTQGFLQKRIAEQSDIKIIIPEESHLQMTHDLIANELTQGNFSAQAKTFYINQMQLLKNRGADGIILGCTELPMLLDDKDFSLPMLNTTFLHAQMARDFILSDL